MSYYVPQPTTAQVFLRSIAVTVPLIAFFAAAVLFVCVGIRESVLQDDRSKARSKFLRALANSNVDLQTLLWFDQQIDPIETAKNRLRHMTPNDPLLKPISEALVSVL